MVGKSAAKMLSYRWLLFAILALAYCFVYFHRMSLSVVAGDLAQEFQATASAIGLLGSIYFYCYAAMQIPAGLLSDSVGPRRTVASSLLLATVGSVLFALAPSMRVAMIARIMVALGVSMVFIPTMKILAQWFRSREFAFMSGMMQAAGGVGILGATSLLGWLATLAGWRASFAIIAGGTLLLVLAAWWIVRDRPADKGWPSITEIDQQKIAAQPRVAPTNSFVGVASDEPNRGEGVPPLRREAILASPSQGKVLGEAEEQGRDTRNKGKMPSPRLHGQASLSVPPGRVGDPDQPPSAGDDLIRGPTAANGGGVSAQKVSLWQGVRTVAAQKYFWPVALWFFFDCGIFFGFGNLWSGPYLSHTYGMSKVQTAGVLSMIAWGMVLGGPVLGLVSQRVLHSRKKTFILCMCALVILLLALTLFPTGLSWSALAAWFFLFSVFSSAIVVMGFTTTKELFPVEIAGTCVGMVNFFPFFGGGIFQWLLGRVLDAYGKSAAGQYPLEAYRAVLLVLLVTSVAALACTFLMKETYRK